MLALLTSLSVSSIKVSADKFPFFTYNIKMRKNIIYRTALIAVLTALACVLRLWLVALPNVKPITAMFLAFALVLGLTDSLWIMALTMLATGLILGFSPLVAGQIIVYALIIMLFKSLAQLTTNLGILSLLTALSALLYGCLISVFSGLLYGFGPGGFLAYWLAGLPFDLAHALSTFIFFPIVMLILKQIKTRH